MVKTGQQKASRNMIVWKKALCIQDDVLYGIGYRKHCLVKLRIKKGTRINVRNGRTISSRKCRAEEAEVLGFYSCRSSKKVKYSHVVSEYNQDFHYRIGDRLKVRDFDLTLNACSTGIHYFAKRSCAVWYRFN